jgi:hypothetical protein
MIPTPREQRRRCAAPFLLTRQLGRHGVDFRLRLAGRFG